MGQLGGRQEAADALGVTKQHIARLLSGGSGLSVIAAVQAAVLTGRDVPRTLRELGEANALKVLEAGFGGGQVSRPQRKILDKIHDLTPPARRHFLGVLDELPPGQPNDRSKR